MFFTNVFYDTRNSILHLWEKDGDTPSYSEVYWAPYVFMRDAEGDTKTIDGEVVRKKEFSNYQNYYNYCKDNYSIYENKVRPEIQFLTESYHSIPDDEIPVPRLKIYSIDIEVAHEEGFPHADKAEFPVVCITIYDNYTGQSITFGEKEYKGRLAKNAVYLHCDREEKLLQKFFKYLNKFPADVISGWNIWNFDLPYLINRTKNLFGKDTNIYKLMSPINVVRTWESKKFGDMNIDIAGVTILDFMDLYKWYSPHNLERYSLDFVSNFELEKGKIDYSEYQDLMELYRKDWSKFVRYNITDAKRVYQLEEKCGYIKLVQSLSLLTKVPMKYYPVMTQLIEGALLTHYRRNGMCAPYFGGGYQESFEAAYVKEPHVGMYDWVVDLDIASSYPTAIITLNMSLETFFGRIINLSEEQVMSYMKRRMFPEFEMYKETGKVKFSGPKLQKFNSALDRGLLAIAPCGSVFTTSTPGVLADVERGIFSKRVEVKDEMIGLKKKISKLVEGAEKRERLEERIQQLFDLQWALKILLNAMFGVTAVPYSRYFNTNISEAITACGRETIKAGERIVNQLLQTKWIENDLFLTALHNSVDPAVIEQTKHEDWVVYIDTDSLFIRLGDWLTIVIGDAWTESDDKDKIRYIRGLSHAIEQYVDARCYDEVQKLTYNSQVEDFRIAFKQEIIAKAALFVKKKKYAYWCVDEEGAPVDKIKVTGLEIVRSDSSEAVRERLRVVVEMILKKAPEEDIISILSQYKKELKNVMPEEIAANIGVKNIEKYVKEDNTCLKGTPWHVKGVANYRKLLEMFKLEKVYEDIHSGLKARVVYIKPNPYKMETVTFHRWPKEFNEAIEIDYDKMIDKFFVKKIKFLLEPMGKVDLLEGEMKQTISAFFGG
jgi:DNA polymerase elongation subunit (family B)